MRFTPPELDGSGVPISRHQRPQPLQHTLNIQTKRSQNPSHTRRSMSSHEIYMRRDPITAPLVVEKSDRSPSVGGAKNPGRRTIVLLPFRTHAIASTINEEPAHLPGKNKGLHIRVLTRNMYPFMVDSFPRHYHQPHEKRKREGEKERKRKTVDSVSFTAVRPQSREYMT